MHLANMQPIASTSKYQEMDCKDIYPRPPHIFALPSFTVDSVHGQFRYVWRDSDVPNLIEARQPYLNERLQLQRHIIYAENGVLTHGLISCYVAMR
jgi:hypothetical protein